MIACARSLGEQLHLPLDTTRRPLLVVLATPPSPCPTCPRRAACRAPCDALEAILPPGDPRSNREVPSLAVTEGRPVHPDRDLTAWLAERTERAPDHRTVQAAQAALGRLSAVQRVTLTLHLDGRTGPEIAAQRGVTRQAVHKDLKAALAALRKELCRG